MKKFGQIRTAITVSYKLLQFLWKHEKKIFILNIFAVLTPAIFPFINAYIFKLIIDRIVSVVSGQTLPISQFYYLFGIMALTIYLERLSFSYQNYAVKIMYTKVPVTLYQMILDKISSLDMQYFEDSDFRDTLQKVQDNYSWKPQELMWLLFFLLQSLVQVVIALIAVVSLNFYLALLLTLVAVPQLVNQLMFSKFSWSIWDVRTPHRKRFQYLSSLIQERTGIKEIKIFDLKNRFLSEITKNQTEFFKESEAVANREMKANTGFNLLDTAVMTGVVVFIVLQAIAKKITVGDISFYQSVISNFSNGIGGLFRNLSRIFDYTLYVKYIFDVMEIETKITTPQPPVVIDHTKTPLIEFKNITFTYPGTGQKVFKNFSMVINPGEKIALVGENGAGKTTLIKLLSRFYDVDEGEILIDGVNLKKLDLQSWYKCLGVLFQDYIKYEYPVKDNIFFGRAWEKENLEEIIEAAKSAGAHDMIRKFENQYDQMLGRTFDGGLELSGGQWQKVALSRAFYRGAPLLILDEPTASLDARAESVVFDRVEKISKNKSVIIISHRFSTVRNADKIYVIENGQILEQGSHSQLMKLDGQYASLFKLQAKGYL